MLKSSHLQSTIYFSLYSISFFPFPMYIHLKKKHDWSHLIMYVFKFQLYTYISYGWSSQVALVVKNPPANAEDRRDAGLIPESGRFPGRGHSNSFQYSCLENPKHRGAWQAIVQSHRVGHATQHTCMLCIFVYLYAYMHMYICIYIHIYNACVRNEHKMILSSSYTLKRGDLVVMQYFTNVYTYRLSF